MKTRSKSKTNKLKAFCWRTGVIGFGRILPKGALPLGTGPGSRLRDAVAGVARVAYPAKPGGKSDTLLVPGVLEAKDSNAALDAVLAFHKQVKSRLSHKS